MDSHYQHLGAEERGTIIALRSQEIGVRELARVLTRAPSTILRELRRNGEQLGRGTDRRGQMRGLPSIHLRPPSANERLLPGHWPGDLIRGAANRSAVGVLFDRRTLFLMIVRMERATTQAALAGFSQAFEPLPAELRQTLTYDQGKEPVEIFFEYCFQARDEESVALDA